MNEIRKVITENDIVAVGALAREIWTEHYTPIIGPAQVEYMLKNMQSEGAISKQIKDGYLYFVIRDTGYFSVLPAKEYFLLSKFYVRKEYRGKGCGRKIMDFVENLAREKGYSKLVLFVNKNNTGSFNAYIKMGFKIVDSVKTDIGGGFYMDDYKMQKILMKAV